MKQSPEREQLAFRNCSDDAAAGNVGILPATTGALALIWIKLRLADC
jgi:hypothetical protein